MVVAVVEMKNHTTVVHQGVHKLEVLASRRGYDGSTNWDYMCCCMRHWLVVFIDPQHWLVQLPSPSLKE